MNLIKLFATLAAILLLSHPSNAEVQLPDIISDNMVLQQNTDARLWGWATPGSRITVTPSWNREEPVSGITGTNGRWDVSLPTPTASFIPHSITVTGDKTTLRLDNILVGEVWFCSGQSNMEMTLEGYTMQPVDEAPRAIAYAANYPGIRVAVIKRGISYTPQERVEGKWLECTPVNAPQFSATAFFFARALTDLIHTPVGIIVCAYGGSKVEGWQPRQQLEAYGLYDIDREAADSTFNDMHRSTVMYNYMLRPLIGYTIKGFLWNQGESNVGEHDTYPLHLSDMVSHWRQEWGLGMIPFYQVEIPGWIYGGVDETPAAFFRECQHAAARDIPNSAIISTADLVYPDRPHCIHSPIKRPLGERLAFMAAARTYGLQGLPVDYPMFESMTVDGNRASVTLTNTPVGFYPFQDLEGFEAAGSDGTFHRANAWGDWEKRTLEISCPEVDSIQNVRYNFKNFSVSKIHNHQGLPLVPFRTDR